MMGQGGKLRLCRMLLILNLCFIWGNSLLPAEVSRAFSDSVHALLGSFRPATAETIAGAALLRKMAHFAEFLLLGLLLSWNAVLLKKKHRYVLPVGVAAACVDEMIQLFVPGRGPGILDVGIDTCGVAAGMILLRIGYLIFKKTNQ